MRTSIEKEFVLPEAIDQVWTYLSDPARIVGCVPGASLTEKVDEKNYKGQVTASFGPVKASYNGSIEIVILDHGEGWTSLVTDMATLSVRVGETVIQGSPLGRTGAGTPRVTVELRRSGRPVDITPMIG